MTSTDVLSGGQRCVKQKNICFNWKQSEKHMRNDLAGQNWPVFFVPFSKQDSKTVPGPTRPYTRITTESLTHIIILPSLHFFFHFSFLIQLVFRITSSFSCHLLYPFRIELFLISLHFFFLWVDFLFRFSLYRIFLFQTDKDFIKVYLKH